MTWGWPRSTHAAITDMLPAASFTTRSGWKIQLHKSNSSINDNGYNLIMMAVRRHRAEVEARSVISVVACRLTQKFHLKANRANHLHKQTDFVEETEHYWSVHLFCMIVRGMKNKSRTGVWVLWYIWHGKAQHVQCTFAQRIFKKGMHVIMSWMHSDYQYLKAV